MTDIHDDKEKRPTPRTDALLNEDGFGGRMGISQPARAPVMAAKLADHARQLERELAEANRSIDALQREVKAEYDLRTARPSLAAPEGESRWLVERTYAPGFNRQYWTGAQTSPLASWDHYKGDPVWTDDPLEAARYATRDIAYTLRLHNFHPERPVDVCEHLFQCGTTAPSPLAATDDDQAPADAVLHAHTEICELFAKNSGTYDPTPDEVDAIQDGLTLILGNMASAQRSHTAALIPEGFYCEGEQLRSNLKCPIQCGDCRREVARAEADITPPSSSATSRGTSQGRVADLEETFDPDPQDWEAARHNQADNYIAMKHLALELQRELDWSDHNWTSMVRRAERAEEKLHKIDVSLNAAGAPENSDFGGVKTKLSRRGRLRALVDDLEGKLDAVAEALDHPKRAWRMAGCDVLAHQVRDLLKNYIALRDAPTAPSPLAATDVGAQELVISAREREHQIRCDGGGNQFDADMLGLLAGQLSRRLSHSDPKDDLPKAFATMPPGILTRLKMHNATDQDYLTNRDIEWLDTLLDELTRITPRSTQGDKQ